MDGGIGDMGGGGPSTATGAMDRGRASTTYATPSSDAYEGGRLPAVAGRREEAVSSSSPLDVVVVSSSLWLLRWLPGSLPSRDGGGSWSLRAQ